MNHRYDFVYLFDCKDGNPNGDPDAANAPRIDPQDMHGLVSDVCLKRKVRNYVLAVGGDGRDIFVQTKSPLNPRIADACKEANLPDYKKADGKWDADKAKGRSQKDIRSIQQKLCARYFDVRTFGAVMSTGPNAGQIRGPVQLTFSRSVDSILPLDLSITRVTDVDKEEGEMGRKNLIPYGLYRCHGFISAHLARETGFSEADLALFWQALQQMFDHDRSASRGTMAPQKLIVFKHATPLGNAPAHKLFERVVTPPVGTPRSFADYQGKIIINRDGLPQGVELIEML
ncbi:MAG: type I-C CRISPR-associated protein Cas7/Csd2 [Candidatus Brocadiia bacterium]